MKKMLALALSLLMVVGLFTTSALAEPITLEYWTVFTGGDGDTMQSMVDLFNSEHPDIQVNHSPMAQADLYEKLPLAVQTGSGVPDVIICHISHIAQLTDDGFLTDVSYLTENGVDMTNYPEWMVDEVTIDELPYGVPFDLHGAVTCVNLELLNKYGMNSIIDDRAITFDEVLALKDAIDAAGDTDVYAANYYVAKWLYLRLYQEKAGKSWLNEAGELDIDLDIFTEVVEDLRSLNEKGAIRPVDENDKSLFLGGRLVLYTCGTWSKNTIQSGGIDFIEVIPMGYTGETTMFATSSHMFAQPVDDDRTEEEDKAVATFVDWMGEHSNIWAEVAGQMAVHSKVFESEEAKNLPQYFIVSEEYGDRAMMLNYYYMELLENALDRVGLSPLYDSSVDAASVGAGIVQEINDALAQK